jgi:DNA-binding response OmpR family regulator
MAVMTMMDQNQKIYLLDEASHSVALLEKELAQYNLETRHFVNLESGLDEIRKSPPDLLMLDPNKIGNGEIEIIQQLKSVEELKWVPFLISSDAVPEAGVVQSLDFGGDDFLPKPVKIGEAVSRIRGLLRRKKMRVTLPEEEEQISFDRLVIFLNDHEVKSNGRTHKLTTTETKILKELAIRPGLAVTRQNLIQSVWPENKIVEDQNLDVHISSIRKKIEVNPKRPDIILTIRGIGYKLNLS